MNALPIVHRELLLLTRRRWFYWLRSGVGVAIVLAACSVFAVTSSATTFQELGAPLFVTITTLSYLICLLAGPVLLADSITEERSNGTLGLLLLTRTRSPDIVGGKFVAMAMPALHCLLASLPILAIAFFLGGVSAGEFLRTTGALLSTLLFSLAAAMLCSVLLRTGRSAFAVSLLVVMVCGAGLPFLELLKPPQYPAWHWVRSALASPGLALWNSVDLKYSLNPSAYTFAFFTEQAMGWACLLLAALSLHWRWKDPPPDTGSSDQRRSWIRIRTRSQSTRRPGHSPMTWLARHRLGGALPVWLLTLAFTGTQVWMVGEYLQDRLPGAFVLFAAYLMHGLFKIWVGWTSSRAFGPERDSGALELLLVTPLGETEIWRAWLSGLQRRFMLPTLAMMAADLAMAWHAAVHADQGLMQLEIFFLTLPAALVFLLDCHALSWCGLWNGLVALNATRACLRTLLPVLIAPGLVFTTLFFGAAAANLLDYHRTVAIIVTWAVTSFGLDIAFTVLAMSRLSHDCREASTWGRLGRHRLLNGHQI